MAGTWPRHAQVVIGGNGVDHVGISTCSANKFERTANDTGNVFQVVSTVKLSVPRQYLGLYELYEVEAGTVCNHKKCEYFCKYTNFCLLLQMIGQKNVSKH